MKSMLSGEQMNCEENVIRGAYVCVGSEYLLKASKMTMQAVRKRSTKDHMVPSEVIASRAYNDVVSTHIMLLTRHYLPERF